MVEKAEKTCQQVIDGLYEEIKTSLPPEEAREVKYTLPEGYMELDLTGCPDEVVGDIPPKELAPCPNVEDVFKRYLPRNISPPQNISLPWEVDFSTISVKSPTKGGRKSLKKFISETNEFLKGLGLNNEMRAVGLFWFAYFPTLDDLAGMKMSKPEIWRRCHWVSSPL